MFQKRMVSLLICMSLLLSGCGNTVSADNENTEEATVMETTEAVMTPYDEMIQRSLWRAGNLTRLNTKIQEAIAGEETVIAYIGGSITEGCDVKASERYVKLATDAFREAFGCGDNVTFVNAGLSGTPSNLGVLRLQRDVLAYEPDIVFVEFAVNDSQDFQEKQCYESLVRTVLLQENAPAVVLLFNRTEDGYTAQGTMGLIGNHYDLPMVSVANAITPELEEGRMQWSDFSNDMVHPNAYGHQITADMIEYLFRMAQNAEVTGYAIPEAPLYKAPYTNAVMITPEDENTQAVEIAQLGSFEWKLGGRTGFPQQWHYNGGSEPMVFTVKANAVFLIFNRNKTANMGAVDVYINGEKAMTIQAQQPDGWGDPWSQLLVSGDAVQTYTVEIYPAEGCEGKIFDIYGIAYSQNG